MVRSDPTLSGSESRFRSNYGGNSMNQDWLLTLLVLSPALLIATITVFVLTRKLAQTELAHRGAVTHVHDGADQIEEVHGNLP
jgi:hypothetical protein